MLPLNIILHITTSCNYNCSYCDVIKDKKSMSIAMRQKVIEFIVNNASFINRFKFFGGEPTLAFKDISAIIEATHTHIGNNFEIVTNTTLLTPLIGESFERYFKLIFLSIDTENSFDYEKVLSFVHTYHLEEKVYFNLVINPGTQSQSLEQFYTLYHAGMRGFNILPVYFTKHWTKEHLASLSKIMKEILDLSLKDSQLRLYGFQENIGYTTSLANNTLFIDIDGSVYYSDMASTGLASSIKQKLFLGNIETFSLQEFENMSLENARNAIVSLEEKIYENVVGQRQLHKIMDYFSSYLNHGK